MDLYKKRGITTECKGVLTQSCSPSGDCPQLVDLPAHGQVPLCSDGGHQKGDPRHGDVLHGVPEVREDVDVDCEVDAPHLYHGVLPDAGGDEHNVKHGEGD